METNKEAAINPKSVNLFSGKKKANIKYNNPATSIAGIFGKSIKLQNSRTVCNINNPKSNKKDSLEKSVAKTSTNIYTNPDNERVTFSFILQIF